MNDRTPMPHPNDEPNQDEFEAMQADEELEFVRLEDAPEDVKSEVLERLDRYRESDLESASPDGTPIE